MSVSRLTRWRWAVLSIWGAAIVMALVALGVRYGQDHFWIDNSVGVWFQADDPELSRYAAHNAAFGEREWTLVLLEAKTSIFESGFLRHVASITRRLQDLENVVKVTSIANVRDNRLTVAAS